MLNDAAIGLPAAADVATRPPQIPRVTSDATPHAIEPHAIEPPDVEPPDIGVNLARWSGDSSPPPAMPVAPAAGDQQRTIAQESVREGISLKEKARRKAQRNLVMLGFGLAILLLALGLLLRLSGK